MKLTGQQLDALVSKLSQEESKQSQYNLKYEAALKDPKNKALAKKYRKTLASIPEKIRGIGSYHSIEMTERQFLVAVVKSKLKEPKDVDRYDIKNRILIASIDAETMLELQRKLKIKL